jgi:hypothetical protein
VGGNIVAQAVAQVFDCSKLSAAQGHPSFIVEGASEAGSIIRLKFGGK